MALTSLFAHGLWPVIAGAFVVVLLLSLNTRWQRSRRAKMWNCAPAPRLEQPWYDILGLSTAGKYGEASKANRIPFYLLEGINRMSKKLGRPVTTYSLNVLGNQWFMTHDPQNLKAMLATQFHDYGIGARGDVLKPLLGPGIFTTEGAAWSHSRSILRPAFNKDHIYRLPGLEKACQELIQVLSSSLDLATNIFPAVSGKHQRVEDGRTWTRPVNIMALFFRLTIDNSTELLFGKSTESLTALLDPTQAGRVDFAEAFDRAQELTIERSGWGPLAGFVKSKEYAEQCKLCHDFVDGHVEKVLGRRASEKVDEKDYLLLNEVAKETRDAKELRFEMLNVLLAGRDTTASTLSWAFHLLARSPDVVLKLRESIIETFGSDSTEDVNFEKLKTCQYLQYTIKEVLRMFPIVAANSRMANHDTTLPTGGGPNGSEKLFITKGTVIGYSTFVMQRHPAIWGEDANQFKPERWVGRTPGWDFVPFSGGPRICIGQQFALMTIAYTLVRLLQRYDQIVPLDEVEEPEPFIAITMRPAKGIRVQLREAEAI